MRSTERLIRQLTNARISVVHDEQKTALKKVTDTHSLAEAPKTVRDAVAQLKKIESDERKLKRLIETAGYKSYHYDTKLYRNNSDKERSDINERATNRVAKIEALRAEALIDTIGTAPDDAKAALVAFRSSILKV